MTEKKTSVRGKKSNSKSSSTQSRTVKSKQAAVTKTTARKQAPVETKSNPIKVTQQATTNAAKASTPMKPQISAEELMIMIAEQAYYRAEKRGFNGGDPVADWLEAEQEIKSLFAA